jgi:hypothetical protein
MLSNEKITSSKVMARSHGVESRQMAHDQEIVGSNPGTVYWMDVRDASYYIKEKLKIKVAKWGTPKKNILKTNS